VTTYAIVRVQQMSLDAFASAVHLHPDHVRRLVALGLLDARTDASGGLWFSRSQIAVAARLQRLREGLDLNYAALGVVVQLLDRIEELEAELRRRPGSGGGGGGARWATR
jgi:hypothetical protein